MKNLKKFIKNNKIFCFTLFFIIAAYIAKLGLISPAKLMLIAKNQETTFYFDFSDVVYIASSFFVLYLIKKTSNLYLKLLGLLLSICAFCVYMFPIVVVTILFWAIWSGAWNDIL